MLLLWNRSRKTAFALLIPVILTIFSLWMKTKNPMVFWLIGWEAGGAFRVLSITRMRVNRYRQRRRKIVNLSGGYIAEGYYNERICKEW